MKKTLDTTLRFSVFSIFMANPGSGGSYGSSHSTSAAPPIGDWRKGSADIKLLLKNLYTQSPMLHTDVTFKVTEH